jgi:hypothetical protein
MSQLQVVAPIVAPGDFSAEIERGRDGLKADFNGTRAVLRASDGCRSVRLELTHGFAQAFIACLGRLPLRTLGGLQDYRDATAISGMSLGPGASISIVMDGFRAVVVLAPPSPSDPVVTVRFPVGMFRRFAACIAVRRSSGIVGIDEGTGAYLPRPVPLDRLTAMQAALDAGRPVDPTPDEMRALLAAACHQITGCEAFPVPSIPAFPGH